MSTRSADSYFLEPKGAPGEGSTETLRWGGCPPLGGASIASGYTPSALAGAMPRHPLPLKGRKVQYRRRSPLQNLRRSKQKENPPAQSRPHQKSTA